MHVKPGDFIRFLDGTGTAAELSYDEAIKVNSSKIVILNPDVLISGTTVSNAIGCLRRAVINHRFKVRLKISPGMNVN